MTTLCIPPLRPEIRFFPGPDNLNGIPTWTLYDPAANRYFRMGLIEFRILSAWNLGDANSILQHVNTTTTIRVDADMVTTLASFLMRNNLTRIQGSDGIKRLLQQSKPPPVFKRLLHGYLFFRIPVFKPDRCLAQLSGYTEWFFSPTFWTSVAALALLGIYLISRQWDSFIHSFSYLFSFDGALLLMVSLFFTKVAHEFGHAIAAQHYGCRVTTIGIAFMVLWPILYSDISDVAKLRSRKHRLAIGIAGVGAELIIASIATLVWSLLPDGSMRSIAFFFATTAWIMTLLINLSPFMRFDGYYLFSDWLGIENLHERAFAMGRWFLRGQILGLQSIPPEYLPVKLRRMLIIFAFATWLYRLVFFLGIAFVVYHLFFKLVGIFLMLVELYWFIVRPVVSELAIWCKLPVTPGLLHRMLGVGAIAVCLIILTIIPWKSAIELPAVFKRAHFTVVFATTAARVESVHVKMGDKVVKDQRLLQLNSPDLEHRIFITKQKIKLYEWQLQFQRMDRSAQDNFLIIRQKLEADITKYHGYLREQQQLQITAPFNGIVLDVTEHLSQNDWVSDKEPLLKLGDAHELIIEAYLQEADIKRVQNNARCRFYPENPDWETVPCHVTSIDPINTKQMTSPYFASHFGGDIPVLKHSDGTLVPQSGVYRMLLTPVAGTSAPQQMMRGSVVVMAEPSSFLKRIWHTIVSVLVRESGF